MLTIYQFDVMKQFKYSDVNSEEEVKQKALFRSTGKLHFDVWNYFTKDVVAKKSCMLF